MFSQRKSSGLLGFAALLLLIAAAMVHFFPGYLTNAQYVSGIIVLEILVAVVWNYRQRFVPTLVVVFLGAGLYTPVQPAFSTIRWVVLAIGALVGVVLYLHEQGHWFGAFHLLALSCILSSFASAVVSNFQGVACLKAASLLLLFVYGMTGARFAAFFETARFLGRLQLGLEILTYVAAITYFVFHYPLLGNPNSLGAVMGVAVFPLLLWGVLTTGEARLRHRRQFALFLSLLLLLSSYSRASIGAAFLAAAWLCVGLRQYKKFFRGIALTLVSAVVIAALVPIKSDTPDDNRTPVKRFLYKGHAAGDLLQSRRSVWDQTLDSIRVHPYFGTGFGTSETSDDTEPQQHSGLSVSSNVGVREHGNSYLAILEWQGVLGVAPFAALLLLLVSYLGRVFRWMRRHGDASTPAVALSATIAAGLFHAGFEDWLFAVGYYLCVFFWMMAFIFVDVLPQREVAGIASKRVLFSTRWPHHGAIARGR